MKTLNRYIFIFLSLIGLLLRIFPVTKYGFILNEFDPYFNYKVANYIIENGFLKFCHWKDEKVWFPYGREIFDTCYPGMMIYTYFIQKLFSFFRIEMNTLHLCVFFPLIASLFTFIGFYKLAAHISKNENISMIAYLFFVTSPSYLCRSNAGFYDYECVSIGLILWCFYYYLKCREEYTLYNFLLLLFMYINLSISWGGYVYVINLLAVHSCFIAISDYFNIEMIKKENIENKNKFKNRVFILLYLIGNGLLYFIPIIGKRSFLSDEQILPFICASIQVCLTNRNRYFNLFLLTLLSILFFRNIIKGKIFDLIFFKKSKSALVQSISEYNPRNFFYYFLDLHILLFFQVPSIRHFLSMDIERSTFMFIYFISSIYLSSKMLRLLITSTPCFSIAGSFTVGEFITKTKKRLFLKISCASVSILYFLHCLYMATEVYSIPNIITVTRSNKILNDFQETHNWLNMNTEGVILAWWDYGYQINAQTNLTTLCDNNTSRWDRIGLVAEIFCSKEKKAYELCIENNVDYVYIVSGIDSGYKFDYIGKFDWIKKIAKENGNIDAEDEDSILYQMSYYHSNGYDMARDKSFITNELTYFDAIYTSQNGIVKIFKVIK